MAPAVSILGLGSIGMRHAINLLGLGAQVYGFDPELARRELLTQTGGIALASRDEAFRSGAIVIASPNSHHLADLRDALSAGCHVFAEKPLAHTEDGIDALLNEAERKGQIVFAGLNLRFHAAVRRAHEIIANDRLGHLLWSRILASAYLPFWRPQQDHRLGYTADPATGGAIFDNIHEIDLAYFLFGPGQVKGACALCSGTLGIEAEDIASIIIQHERGLLCEVHLDYATPRTQRGFEVAGTNGHMIGDLLSRKLTLLDADGIIVLHEELPGSFAEDYVDEMRSFLSCVTGLATPPCDGRQALEVLRLAIASRHLSGLPTHGP